MINGVFCHETGCPNARSRYDEESGEWIKQRKCFECGCTVDASDLCCSAPVEDEDGDTDIDDYFWPSDDEDDKDNAEL
jgi:hypothetical protein